MNWIDIIKKFLLDVFFPQHLKCHSCGREAVVNEYGICASCESKLLFVSDPGRIEGIDDFASALQYDTTVKRAMIPFKYCGALYKKEFLIHHVRIPEAWSADCIVPVPLHPTRLKKRGYNQSLVLAEAIGERYSMPVRTDLLHRIKDTPQQAHLNRKERIKNVKNAFSASDGCNGMNIILFDDVRTTGSTLRECAQELRRRGANRIYALTACCSMEEVIKDG